MSFLICKKFWQVNSWKWELDWSFGQNRVLPLRATRAMKSLALFLVILQKQGVKTEMKIRVWSLDRVKMWRFSEQSGSAGLVQKLRRPWCRFEVADSKVKRKRASKERRCFFIKNTQTELLFIISSLNVRVFSVTPRTLFFKVPVRIQAWSVSR